jgi:hypothetical protein
MYSKRTNENNTKGTINPDKHDDIIDLTTVDNTPKRYLCPQCKELLQDWPAAKFYNPHAGPSYRCPTCDKIYDSSLQKLPTLVKKSKPTMANTANANEPIVMFLNDNASIEKRDEEYDRHDPEPGYDEGLKQDGWHIIESRLELRDRLGNNRTLFKRDTDHGSATTQR